jgi:hypothetical protein
MKSLLLIDGCLLFDNSALEKLQLCPVEYLITQVAKRVASGHSAGANFGSACHLALKTRYLAYDNNIVEDDTTMREVVAQHFTDNPEPAGDYRNFDLASAFITAYNHIYPREPFHILNTQDGKLFVERSFMSPFGTAFWQEQAEKWTVNLVSQISNASEWATTIKLQGGIPIFYTGRIDLGIEDNEGQWVMDHKSTFQFGQNNDSELLIMPQTRGYMWEFRNYYGQLPAGYIINSFRVRKPCKDSEFDDSKKFDSKDFKRTVVNVPSYEIEEWQSNTGKLIELFFYYWKTEFPRYRTNCVRKYGACQFYDLCKLPIAQRPEYLASTLFTPNTWTALNEPIKNPPINITKK